MKTVEITQKTVELKTIEVPDYSESLNTIKKLESACNALHEARKSEISAAGDNVVEQMGRYLEEVFKPFFDHGCTTERFGGCIGNYDTHYTVAVQDGYHMLAVFRITADCWDVTWKCFGEDRMISLIKSWGSVKRNVNGTIRFVLEHKEKAIVRKRDIDDEILNLAKNFEV